ncbi:MAG: hypothetical protein HN737_10770 [Desulfobacterales bacterium]|jgi:hypothetical protein|nr:hypothetical protein [Desulfobacteraceae bacterium]MBT4362946.1 hypothetical protein [Desulfobacteraceae bacterium]MBT7086439.1 hypothetical protein [Desulfobacterales bacterium]MBT7697877.1 hypothetical protein [Desulfobacterales bacterium]
MINYEELSKDELIKRAKLTSELAIAIDGLWFLSAEKANGFDKALDMDIEVWERYFSVSIKRIRKYFDIKLNGLEGIKEIMRYDPMWDPIGYELIEDSPDSLIFQVHNCPALEGMEKIGREILTCEPVEGAYLKKLAETCDPKLKVKALKLPPRKSPDELCCQWRFFFED